MISSVLDERRLPSLRGRLAIAHCRYSTTGSTVWENAQPTFRLGPRRAIAIGHNGNLVNTRQLLDQLHGGRAAAGLDRHRVADRAPRRRAGRGHGRGPAARPSPRPRGVQPRRARRAAGHRRARSVRLPAPRARPPAERGEGHGLWGDDDASTGWCIASGDGGAGHRRCRVRSRRRAGRARGARAGVRGRSASLRRTDTGPVRVRADLLRPADTYMEGRNLYEARRRMGLQLAIEHPADTDMVMPVPDTGAPAAAGFAEGAGIPYREGLVRNRYTGRTFIQPSQTMRQRGVTIKLNPLREVVRGRRLTVVDDSIVRGTTTKQIVSLLRRAGATEVHLASRLHRSTTPASTASTRRSRPSSSPRPTPRRRSASSSARIARLPVDPGRPGGLDLPYERFCFACFDGHYPEPVPYDAAARKFMLEGLTVGRA